jgi:hypothetical protein
MGFEDRLVMRAVVGEDVQGHDGRVVGGGEEFARSALLTSSSRLSQIGRS